MDSATELLEEGDAQLLGCLLRGAYAAALREPLALELLPTTHAKGLTESAIAVRVLSLLEAQQSERARRAAAASVVALGANCLSLFVQYNWTGPYTAGATSAADDGAAATDGAAAAEAAEAADGAAAAEAAAAALDLEGESAYTLLRSPSLLLYARALLIQPLAALCAASKSAEPSPHEVTTCGQSLGS